MVHNEANGATIVTASNRELWLLDFSFCRDPGRLIDSSIVLTVDRPEIISRHDLSTEHSSSESLLSSYRS